MQFSKSFLLAAAATLVSAQIPDLSGLPSCAAGPAIANLGSSGCAITDIKCICLAKGLFSSLQTTIQADCSADDIAKTLKFAQTLCATAGVCIDATGNSFEGACPAAPAPAPAPAPPADNNGGGDNNTPPPADNGGDNSTPAPQPDTQPTPAAQTYGPPAQPQGTGYPPISYKNATTTPCPSASKTKPAPNSQGTGSSGNNGGSQGGGSSPSGSSSSKGVPAAANNQVSTVYVTVCPSASSTAPYPPPAQGQVTSKTASGGVTKSTGPAVFTAGAGANVISLGGLVAAVGAAVALL